MEFNKVKPSKGSIRQSIMEFRDTNNFDKTNIVREIIYQNNLPASTTNNSGRTKLYTPSDDGFFYQVFINERSKKLDFTNLQQFLKDADTLFLTFFKEKLLLQYKNQLNEMSKFQLQNFGKILALRYGQGFLNFVNKVTNTLQNDNSLSLNDASKKDLADVISDHMIELVSNEFTRYFDKKQSDVEEHERKLKDYNEALLKPKSMLVSEKNPIFRGHIKNRLKPKNTQWHERDVENEKLKEKIEQTSKQQNRNLAIKAYNNIYGYRD